MIKEKYINYKRIDYSLASVMKLKNIVDVREAEKVFRDELTIFDNSLQGVHEKKLLIGSVLKTCVLAYLQSITAEDKRVPHVEFMEIVNRHLKDDVEFLEKYPLLIAEMNTPNTREWLNSFLISHIRENYQELKQLAIVLPAYDTVDEIIVAQKELAKISPESVESVYVKPFLDMIYLCNAINIGEKGRLCEHFKKSVEKWAIEVLKNEWVNPFKDFLNMDAIKVIKDNDSYEKKLEHNRQNTGMINVLMDLDFSINKNGFFKTQGIDVLKNLVELSITPKFEKVKDAFQIKMAKILENLIENLTKDGKYKIEEIFEIVFHQSVRDKLIIKNEDSISINMSALEEFKNIESNLFGDKGLFAARYGLSDTCEIQMLLQKSIPTDLEKYISCDSLLRVNSNIVLMDKDNKDKNTNALSVLSTMGFGFRVDKNMPFREKFIKGVENMFVSMTKQHRSKESLRDEFDSILTDVLMRNDIEKEKAPKSHKGLKF